MTDGYNPCAKKSTRPNKHLQPLDGNRTPLIFRTGTTRGALDVRMAMSQYVRDTWHSTNQYLPFIWTHATKAIPKRWRGIGDPNKQSDQMHRQGFRGQGKNAPGDHMAGLRVLCCAIYSSRFMVDPKNIAGDYRRCVQRQVK